MVGFRTGTRRLLLAALVVLAAAANCVDAQMSSGHARNVGSNTEIADGATSAGNAAFGYAENGGECSNGNANIRFRHEFVCTASPAAACPTITLYSPDFRCDCTFFLPDTSGCGGTYITPDGTLQWGSDYSYTLYKDRDGAGTIVVTSRTLSTRKSRSTTAPIPPCQ